jgi:hypothetical protein
MHCHKGRHFTNDILKLIPFVFNEQNSLLKVNPTSEHDTLQIIYINTNIYTHFGENLIEVTQDYKIDFLADCGCLDLEMNLKITASSVPMYQRRKRVKDRRIGCMRLKRMYKQFPLCNIKNTLGDMNAKLGKEIWTGTAVGT